MDCFVVLSRRRADGVFVAWCPDLRGWEATAATESDAVLQAQEIVGALVGARRQQGEPLAPAVRVHTAVVPPMQRPAPASPRALGDGLAGVPPVGADPFGMEPGR